MTHTDTHTQQPSAVVVGGTGFVGHYLIKALIQAGYTVTVPTRQPQRHRDLATMAGVRLADIQDISDAADPSSTASAWVRHLHGHAVLINLVGILNEPQHNGQGFEKAHVVWTQTVLQAAKEASIQRYLHMSALGADAAKGSSFYLRSKGKAEDWAHEYGADNAIAVTSFRPSVIFGVGDSFLNRFVQLAKLMPGAFPLACAEARFAPVYVEDVAAEFIVALNSKDTYGQRLDLCGPTDYSLRQLVAYAARTAGHSRVIIALPDWMAQLQARIMELAPGKPFSHDNYDSLQTPNVCAADCPRQPTRLEEVAPAYLKSR